MGGLESAFDNGLRRRSDRRCGQTTVDFFDFGAEAVKTQSVAEPPSNVNLEFSKATLAEIERCLAWEVDSVGINLTASLEEVYGEALAGVALDPIRLLAGLNDNDGFRVFGVVTAPRTPKIKTGSNAGRYFASFKLSDWSGSTEAVVWPEDFDYCKSLVDERSCVVADGYVRWKTDDNGIRRQHAVVTGIVEALSLVPQ
jgi:hypothetical protein